MYQKTVVLYLIFTIFLVSYGFTDEKMDALFPEPDFGENWEKLDKPTYYEQENLFEYINGEAELYHTYGFKKLAAMIYFQGSIEDTFINVNIYDMGTLLNSFGVYSNYRTPDYKFKNIGVEATISDYEVKFYQSNYFVDIYASYASKEMEDIFLKLASLISQNIGGSLDPPKRLKILPSEDRIDKTLRYISSEMLSQAFLPGGFEAKYQVGKEEISGFVIIFENAEKSKKGLDELRSFFQKSGDEFVSSVLNSFTVKSSYRGYVLLLLLDQYLLGVQDVSDKEKGNEFLYQMSAYVKSYIHDTK
jgi:hypothetical protein